MELRWLEDYIALARTRHFSRAAEARHITQPTFSRRIKLLEEEMGAVLVDRNTLPLTLTPAGEVFLTFAERATRQLQQTHEQLQHIGERHDRKLTVASTQTLYLCFCQPWANHWRDVAEIGFDLNAAAWRRREFNAALLENRCDLVVCHWHPALPSLDDGLHHRALGEDALVPVSLAEDGAPLFSLADASSAALPCIDYSTDNLFHGLIRSHMQMRYPKLTLNSLNRSHNAISVKALVGAGYGVGWLPQRLIQSELDNGTFALAAEDSITLTIRAYSSPTNAKPALVQLWQALGSPCIGVPAA